MPPGYMHYRHDVAVDCVVALYRIVRDSHLLSGIYLENFLLPSLLYLRYTHQTWGGGSCNAHSVPFHLVHLKGCVTDGYGWVPPEVGGLAEVR